MPPDFSKLLSSAMGGKTGGNQASNFVGAIPATVTDNVDPENRYRVKIEYKHKVDKGQTVVSDWARIATWGASKDGVGVFWLPEVGDEVVVVHNNNDPNNAYIVGTVWNGVDVSTPDIDISPDDINEKIPNNDQGGKNDFRILRSRTKHHLVFKDREGEGGISLRSAAKHELYFEDKSGEEKIRLYDKDRKQWLEIDVPEKKITLQTDTGEILIKAKETITMECKNLVVKAEETIAVTSGKTSDWTSTGALTWKTDDAATYESSSGTTVKGSTIDLNP